MPTHIEIERSFLLDALPAFPSGTSTARIEKGYLPPAPAGNAIVGRIRREVHDDGVVRCTHTIKRGAGIRREETEREIDEELFRSEWERTAGRRVSKTRYRVAGGTVGNRVGGGALVWEIDDFDAHDLVLAEIELPTEDAAFDIPPWLASHIVREVTEEAAYRNASIAINGAP